MAMQPPDPPGATPPPSPPHGAPAPYGAPPAAGEPSPYGAPPYGAPPPHGAPPPDGMPSPYGSSPPPWAAPPPPPRAARTPLLLALLALVAVVVGVVVVAVSRHSSSTTVSASQDLVVPGIVAGEARAQNSAFDQAVRGSADTLKAQYGAHSVAIGAYGPVDGPDELLFAATGPFAGGGANAAGFVEGFTRSAGSNASLGAPQKLTRDGHDFSCRTISGRLIGVACVWDEDHYFGAILQLHSADVGHCADFAAAARRAALGAA